MKSLTGMSYDEVQMTGALAYFDGRKVSDNPYKVSDYDIPAGDPRGMEKAIREVAAAWKCGFLNMRDAQQGYKILCEKKTAKVTA